MAKQTTISLEPGVVEHVDERGTHVVPAGTVVGPAATTTLRVQPPAPRRAVPGQRARLRRVGARRSA